MNDFLLKSIETISFLIIIVTGIFAAIVLCFGIIDISSLHSEKVMAYIVNKSVTSSCSPIYGAKGEYVTDICGDDYSFTLLIDDSKKIKDVGVNKSQFSMFSVNDLVEWRFKKGRLGGVYNSSFVVK